MSRDSKEEQLDDDGRVSSEVIDPNVSEIDDQFGLAGDDDPDVAALRADAAEQNKADAQRQPRTDRPQLGLEDVGADELDVDVSREMAITGNDYRPDGPRDDETDQKVSELTMLGVEQMLSRNADSGGRRWLVAVVAVAVLGGFLGGGYWLYDHFSGEGVTAESVTDRVERSVVIPVQDWWAGDRDRFSIRGLQTVIEGAGWQPRGEAGIVELNGRREVRQTYHRDGVRIDTVIHNTPERADARPILEQVDLPARAILFDTKVVVLRPRPDTDPEVIDGVVTLLRRYHEMIVDEE